MAVKGTTPLYDYNKTVGDVEVVPKGIDVGNPAFKTSGVAGVADNHSSTVKSIPVPISNSESPRQEFADMAEGSQWNDDEDGQTAQGYLDFNNDPDPNMSGPHASEPIQERFASAASPWRENNDYLEYMFNTADIPLSRLLYGSVPSGFAANYGYAELPQRDVGSNDMEMEFGTDASHPEGEFGSGESKISGIAVYPIVRRK